MKLNEGFVKFVLHPLSERRAAVTPRSESLGDLPESTVTVITKFYWGVGER